MIFRVGIDDAKVLSPIFHPTFSERDLKEIPHWQAYVSMNTTEEMQLPFNMETLMDTTPVNLESKQRIIEYSRKVYGKPVWLVDKMIRDRRRFFLDKTRPGSAYGGDPET